jgi:RNA polymerase sigma factor (sigma-70 family)
MPPSEQARWFAEEIKPHEVTLRGYLMRRFPTLMDHDDVVQEAYIRLLRAEEKEHLASAKAFLFTVARNVAIDMLRRRQAVAYEPISDLVEMPLLEEAPGIAESMERQQRLEVLIDAIASLPERCREVIMLRHLDGLAYKEIAERLGISPNTVKLHIVKGMRDCTAFFQTQGLLKTGSAAASTSAAPLKPSTP